MITRTIRCLILTTLCAAPVRADEVVLLASVRLAPDARVVLLQDVARLEGPEARALGDLVVADAPDDDAPFELSIRAVRRALDGQGVHWGRVNLSGRGVIVRPHPRTVVGAPTPMQAVSLVSASDVEVRRDVPLPARALIDDPTLRGVLARHFVTVLGAAPDALRLEFDADDEPYLERTTAEWRFELVPEGAAASDLVTIVVRMWREGHILESRTIAVRPLVETATAVLTRDLARDERVAAEDVDLAYRWLSPVQAAMCCPPDVAVGRFAARPLRTGETLRSRHVRREMLVERGERVKVRCLVGGLVINLDAEARADGSEGDVIELRKLGERDSFRATVVGPREAVLDLTASSRGS